MKQLLIITLMLACLVPVFGQWLIDENFDSITTLPAGWITYDDGDGMIWRNLNNVSHAHSGTRAAFADNYFPNQNSDWLITPQLSISAGDSLKFYTRSWTSTENLKVFVSTTGTAISNFGTQLLHLQNIGTTYQAVSYNLSAYAGQNIYVGFFWQCTNYGILVDDIRIGKPLIINAELNLPDSFSFFQGESLSVDFSPYIVATEMASTSISWLPPQHVTVSNQGLTVNFSSPDWNGTENISFTVHDAISGQSATDNVSVIVNAPPLVDLALQAISSPHQTEFVNSAFTPTVQILNNGLNLWQDQVSVQLSIVNAQAVEVHNSEVFFGSALQPAQTSEVVFPALSLGNEGTYTATFSIDADDGNPTNDAVSCTFNVVLRVNTGGPDTFGFRYIDSTMDDGPEFNWIDISTTGTSTIMYGVNTWAGDDNFSEPIPLSFNFPFYGSNYNIAYVDINGEILLAPNSWYDHFPLTGWDGDGNMFNYMYPIPGYTQMPALIAAYWDDLHADQGTGDVYFQTFGQTPNLYTVIQWHNVRFHAGTNATSLLDFEAILHENGEIVMQYNSTATGQTGATVPHDNGKSSTVGLQNESATIGLCYLREIVVNNTYIGVEPSGNLLFNGLAIKFYSGEDQQAPYITHEEVGNTFNTSPVLTARVMDLSPLASVILHYNIGQGWNSVNGMLTGNGYYDFPLPNIPNGNELSYYFQATDELGNSGTLPASAPAEVYEFKILPSSNTEVLVAYSGNQDYQRIELPLYKARLEALNIPYDIYNWEEYDNYAFPTAYSTIIAYASVGSQSPKALFFAQAMMDFMESGTVTNPKNVFFSSDGWAYSQGGTPNSNQMKQLFNAYFRSYYVATGLGGGTNGLAGPENLNYQNGTILCLSNSPIGTTGVEYNVYANSPDCMFAYDATPSWYEDMVQYPEIGATNAFAFEDGPVNGHAYLYHGVCATSVQLPIYRAFYLSFDLSQLSNSVQSEQLFSDLIDWFEVQPSACSDTTVPPLQSSLHSNYPNPFNPSTTIAYSLANPEKVELSIYNLKGQRVKTLMNSIQIAGNHCLVWNGTDESGNGVGSGIYFIKMDTPTLSTSRKITLIK